MADRWGRRTVVAGAVTVVACLLVWFALVAPNQVGRLTPGAFVRIPLEGLVAVALVLVVPPVLRRVLAVLAGLLLGLLVFVHVHFFPVPSRL